MIGGTQHNERWRGKEFSSSFVTLSFILDWKKLISEGKVCPGRWEECSQERMSFAYLALFGNGETEENLLNEPKVGFHQSGNE